MEEDIFYRRETVLIAKVTCVADGFASSRAKSETPRCVGYGQRIFRNVNERERIVLSERKWKTLDDLSFRRPKSTLDAPF